MSRADGQSQAEATVATESRTSQTKTNSTLGQPTLFKILAQAWQDLCQVKDFFALGLRTGCVMPKTGVDRTNLHPIVYDSCPNYSFESAEISGQPTDGQPMEKVPVVASKLSRRL